MKNFNNIIRDLADFVYNTKIQNDEKEKIIKYTSIIVTNYEKISKNIGAPIERDDFLVSIYISYLKSLETYEKEKSSISSYASLIIKRSLQNYIRSYSLKNKRYKEYKVMDKFVDKINESNSNSKEEEYIDKLMWDQYIETKKPQEKIIIRYFLDGHKRVDICGEKMMPRAQVDKCWKDMKNFKQNMLNNI